MTSCLPRLLHAGTAKPTRFSPMGEIVSCETTAPCLVHNQSCIQAPMILSLSRCVSRPQPKRKSSPNPVLRWNAKRGGVDPHAYVLEATRRAIASPDTATLPENVT
jgi:hypothetical protein